jgi:MYXO-CTERM domain-containing protein
LTPTRALVAALLIGAPVLAVAGTPGIFLENQTGNGTQCVDSTPTCGTSTAVGTTSTSFSHTVQSSGSNHYLMVGVMVAVATSQNCTILATYNGVSMGAAKGSAICASGNFCKLSLFGTSISAGLGTSHTVAVGASGCTVTGADWLAGAVSFTNVNGSASITAATAIGTNSGANAITVAHSSTAGQMLVDVAGLAGSTSATKINTQTAAPYWTAFADDFNFGFAAGSVSMKFADNDASTSMQHTPAGSGFGWAIVSVALTPVNGSVIKLDEMSGGMQDDGQVRLDWRTGSEVDNLGFNIYRDDGFGRVRVNASPIIGSALLAGSGISLSAGHHYRFEDFLDPFSKHRPSYWLEDIDLRGTRTLHGPLQLRRLPRLGFPEPVGARAASRTLALDAPEPMLEAAFETSAGLEPGQSHPLQWGLAAAPAIKVGVNREDWYELTGAELIGTGLDPRTDPRRLSLFLDGREVPLEVRGQDDGVLDATDVVGFYGRRLNAASTDTRVYWLTATAGSAARLVPIGAETSVPAPGPDSFLDSREWRPRTAYVPAVLNGDDDNFFGPIISTEALTQVLQLPEGATQLAGPFTLEVGAQGISYAPHRISVEVAGKLIGELVLGQRERGSVVLPLGAMPTDGQVPVTLRSSGLDDTSLVDFLRVTYPRRLAATGGRVTFSVPAGSALTVSGFLAGEEVAVLDVTDPANPQRIQAPPAGADGELRLVVPAGAGQRRLLARSARAQRAPRLLERNRPSGWSAEQRGGDLVVIGPAALLPAIEPLTRLRQSQGWTVASVDVEDIYDEFSFGTKQPGAIKAFVARALRSWQVRPRALILLGDATLDPRDFLGQGAFDQVPTKLLATELIETASDDWFSDFDDDGIADVPVGRLPARTDLELAALVKKLLAAPVYQAREEAAATPLVFVAGDPDQIYDFASVSKAMRGQLRAPWRTLVLDPGGSAVERVAQFREALRGRPALVTYTGHGSMELWSGGMLSSSSVPDLGDDGPGAFWLDLTCLNGFFQDAFRPSLAEVLLSRPSGGAFGVWASSALTEVNWQEQMGKAFLEELTARGATVGEAAQRAKLVTPDHDTRRSWNLFGDPTWRLRAFPPDPPPAPDAGEAPGAGKAAPSLVAGNGAPGADSGATAPAPDADTAILPGDGCSCAVGSSDGSTVLPMVVGLAALLIRRRRRY